MENETLSTQDAGNGIKPVVNGNYLSREGSKLNVADLVEYSPYGAEHETSELCIIAYDFHGYLSMFFTANERWRIKTEDTKNIKFIGNNKTHTHLMEGKLSWARWL